MSNFWFTLLVEFLSSDIAILNIYGTNLNLNKNKWILHEDRTKCTFSYLL